MSPKVGNADFSVKKSFPLTKTCLGANRSVSLAQKHTLDSSLWVPLWKRHVFFGKKAFPTLGNAYFHEERLFPI
ncbi:MAG: hypothetical protein CL920_05025 [Deltaproteobacteria bacterium]|nr:hypothetical protein [Deltaproteobacteria bacterium]MBU48043.1 hypothetical protein [Deltaproteobacteria bacterium]